LKEDSPADDPKKEEVKPKLEPRMSLPSHAPKVMEEVVPHHRHNFDLAHILVTNQCSPSFRVDLLKQKTVKLLRKPATARSTQDIKIIQEVLK
jgi:hypothetical protein